jgi:hypothetical protein
MWKLFLSVLAIGLGAQSASAQDAARIGTTASATDDVQGRRGSIERAIKVGDGVFRDEVIRTGKSAKAQLLFRDETILTMGPSSELVLDKFVYDPDKKAGAMTIKALSGAFRFVSGSAPSQNYRIDTAVGTIGVRGTDISFKIEGNVLTLTLAAGTAAELCATPTSCTRLTQVGTYIISRGGNTSLPQKVGDAACGGRPCRATPHDAPPLVQTFISDVKNFSSLQSSVADRGVISRPCRFFCR